MSMLSKNIEGKKLILHRLGSHLYTEVPVLKVRSFPKGESPENDVIRQVPVTRNGSEPLLWLRDNFQYTRLFRNTVLIFAFLQVVYIDHRAIPQMRTTQVDGSYLLFQDGCLICSQI